MDEPGGGARGHQGQEDLGAAVGYDFVPRIEFC